MPQQLIYTSAPRGIVAGRSGHCTVARSASMREALTLQLEKLSYYQHLSLSGGRERPIFACRIVDIRGTRFHVLSQIQDAGLDFTGRTNFIAHHLVFTPEEIRQFPTPPAILRNWPGWLRSWTKEPQLLEKENWDDLNALAGKSSGPAQTWQRVSGDAVNGYGLLEAQTGASFRVDDQTEETILELFAESLELLYVRGPRREFRTAAWNYTFTTSMQEQDNPADFRWRCIHSDNPAADRFATTDCRTLSAIRATKWTDEEITFSRTGRQAPRFVAEPQNIRITEGGAARFTARAEGVPSPTYQWFSVDRSNSAQVLPNETNPELVVSNPGLGVLRYVVSADNSAGSARSNVATLSVEAKLKVPQLGVDTDSSGPAKTIVRITKSGENVDSQRKRLAPEKAEGIFDRSQRRTKVVAMVLTIVLAAGASIYLAAASNSVVAASNLVVAASNSVVAAAKSAAAATNSAAAAANLVVTARNSAAAASNLVVTARNSAAAASKLVATASELVVTATKLVVTATKLVVTATNSAADAANSAADAANSAADAAKSAAADAAKSAAAATESAAAASNLVVTARNSAAADAAKSAAAATKSAAAASNLVVTARNSAAAASKLVVTPSKLVVTASNLLDTASKLVVTTSKLFVTARNSAAAASELVLTQSELVVTASNLLDTASKLVDTAAKSDVAVSKLVFNAKKLVDDAAKLPQTVRIRNPPTGLTVNVNSTATFTVTATGTAPLAYQWRKDEVTLEAMTNATLSLVNVQTNQAGAYTVVITNALSSITSSGDTLTVNRLAQTITFAALPNKLVGDAPFDLTAATSSGLSVSYTNSAPAVATVSGSKMIIKGIGSTTITARQAGDATNLPATSVNQMLTVEGVPVRIRNPPTGLTVNVNSTATFTVVATGTARLAYQWRKDGVTLEAMTNATLSLVKVQTNKAGAYTVVITNAWGSITSSVAALTVNRLVRTIKFYALPNKLVGDAPFDLTPTTSSRLPMSFSSSNAAVATVSGSTVTIIASGSTWITTSQEGDATYLPATLQRELKILKK